MNSRKSSKRIRAVWKAPSLAGLAALAGCTAIPVPSVDFEQDKPFVIEGVERVTEIAQLTGPGAINDTESVAVAGTDLGSMVNVGDRTYFLFGDTFGDRDPESIGGQGGIWRSNVVAYTTDSNPADGITFDGWTPVDEVGWATAIVEGDHDANTGNGEVTKIPTGGFAVGDTMYVHYMSVSFWGEPGAWDANHSALTRSTDGGLTWEQLDSPRWPGTSNFIQVAAAHAIEDSTEYIYLWAIPAGRFGGVQLMRVPATAESVEDATAYAYFAGVNDAGEPRWADDSADAVSVIEPTVGELSVMWSEFAQRWLMTYSDAGNAYLREGITPWGPWGEPIELLSATEYPGLYSPYLNPRYVSENGRRIYFSLSLWGPYNVFWFSVDLVKSDADRG